MKWWLATLMVLCGMMVFGQQSHKLDDTHAPDKRAQQTIDQLTDKILFITDNQKDSLFTVLKYYYDDLITYRKSKRDNLIPKIVKIRDDQVSKILNENQYKEYLKFMEDARLAEQRRNIKTQKYGNKSM